MSTPRTPVAATAPSFEQINYAVRPAKATQRHMIVETPHTRFDQVRTVNSAVRAGPARTDHRRAPLRNEHATEVLEDLLGYEPDAIKLLTEDGAFGDVSVPAGLGG